MFAKRLPGDMRGAMRGIFYSFGFLRQLLFSQLSILIVNSGFSMSSPFILIACMDSFVIFIAMVMSLAGIFEDELIAKEEEALMKSTN